MMQQNSSGHSLSDAEFSELSSHYKDTYEIHLASIKQRDMLFYALLVVLALFTLQVASTELVNGAITSYVNKQLDLSIGKHSNLFGPMLWLLLFGFSSRYYQTVVQIEREYHYIHHLEDLLNSKYVGTRAFTREGRSYLNEYKIFSGWAGCLYTIAFPLLILLCIVTRIHGELAIYEVIGLSIIPDFISYLLVGTTTILYIGQRHNSSIRYFVTTSSRHLRNLML